MALELPVPIFKIVLETSLARAECGAVLGSVKQVWQMLKCSFSL